MPIALGEGTRRRAPIHAETPPDILEAWMRYQDSGSIAARNTLVVHYMQTHVRPIAARIHAGLPHQVELDDLIQQGYLGLVDAMDRFDTGRGTRFETFSRRRIFGAIQDYLRSIDTVPRLTRWRAKRFQAVQEAFWKTHGRPPTDDELRPLVDMPEPVYRRLANNHKLAATVPFSSVSPGDSDSDDDGDAMQAFEDRRQARPDMCVEKSDLQRWVTNGFDQRDRLIVVLYYYEQMTMLEIGKAIGISESRVSQRLESILACLRSRLIAIGADQEFVF